jgi:hypothetical protein
MIEFIIFIAILAAAWTKSPCPRQLLFH